MSLFASALQANITIPLEAIDFSKNTLDDKKGYFLLPLFVVIVILSKGIKLTCALLVKEVSKGVH